MPIRIGASIVIAKSLHQFKKVFKRILLKRVSIFVAIPPIYDLLSKSKPPWIFRKLLKIRLCISGAAPLSSVTLKDFETNWGIPLLEGYGLSEASPVVSLNPLKGIRKISSVGLPIDGVTVKIVDQDEGELQVGNIGEIIVRGKNVMKGYYKNEEATEEAIRGEWLFTGDIGKIDEDRYVYIVDRKKDMILVRGLNVYPREIEQVLIEYPGIAEVSVVSKSDKHKGEVPVAFIVPSSDVVLNELDIIKYCRKKLADYKVPKQIIIETDLPRTPTGKILKRELRKILI